MAGKKQQAPAKYEEPDEAESWEEGDVAANDKEPEADLRLRDWRDVERYREIKELKQYVDEDDYAALEALFPKPVRNVDPRATGRPRKAAKPLAAAAKGVPPAPAPATKGAAAAKGAKPAPAAAAAIAPAPAKPAVKAAATKPAAKAAAAKPQAKGLLAKMVARLSPKPAAKKPVAKPAARKPAAKAPAGKPKVRKKR